MDHTNGYMAFRKLEVVFHMKLPTHILHALRNLVKASADMLIRAAQVAALPEPVLHLEKTVSSLANTQMQQFRNTVKQMENTK